MDGLFMDPEAFGRSLMCLPSEILALCLAWLPFLDRISVSQVSRFWRSVSLAHPTIWANIDLEGQPDLLSLALSRSGTCPVSLKGSYECDADCVVSQCLREHLHHIRRMVVELPENSLPLHTPAPLLEELVSTSDHIDIPVDFLGGQPARLRTLELSTVSLPTVCLVFSTVTTLSLDVPFGHDNAVTYGRLFELFPRLIALSLDGLEWAFRDLLPRGPAPSSLRKLVLSTEDQGYDLIATHFKDWRAESLRDVRLGQESPPLANIARFFAGFTMLRITGPVYYRRITELTARDAAGRRRTVSFSHTAEDRADVANMLFAHTQDALRSIVHVEVPLAALTAFLPVLAALPELARLGLWIPIGDYGCISHGIPLELVPDILRFKERGADSLRELILHVICPDERCPPTPRDARLLANRVLALGKRGGLPRELIVKGSTCEIFDSTVYFDQQKDSVFELSFQCQ